MGPLSNDLLENKCIILPSNLRSKFLQRLSKLLSKFTQYFLNNLSSYEWIRDLFVQPALSSFTPGVSTLRSTVRIRSTTESGPRRHFVNNEKISQQKLVDLVECNTSRNNHFTWKPRPRTVA